MEGRLPNNRSVPPETVRRIRAIREMGTTQPDYTYAQIASVFKTTPQIVGHICRNDRYVDPEFKSKWAYEYGKGVRHVHAAHSLK